jgi:hypothetical protein
MKYGVIFLLILSLEAFSHTKSEQKDMKTIEIDHPDGKAHQEFLSSIKEAITLIDFDWHSWALTDKIERLAVYC